MAFPQPCPSRPSPSEVALPEAWATAGEAPSPALSPRPTLPGEEGLVHRWPPGPQLQAQGHSCLREGPYLGIIFQGTRWEFRGESQALRDVKCLPGPGTEETRGGGTGVPGAPGLGAVSLLTLTSARDTAAALISGPLSQSLPCLHLPLWPFSLVGGGVVGGA